MSILLKSSVTTLLFLVVLALASTQHLYTPGNDVRCARMWDDLNYEGNKVDCANNERKLNLGPFDCKAQSVIVRNGCTLTIFDKTGCQRQLDRSASCLYGWNNKVSAACCECDGCNGDAPRTNLQCARLYQHQKCSSCSGFRLEINPMDQVTNLHVLNNQISSLIVREGCALTVWEGANFTGTYQTFSGSIDWLDLLDESGFLYEADNTLVPQLESDQPQSDYPYPYPYAYPPTWPLYQHAGIPLPPQPISYYGGPPPYPYAPAPYPWYSPPQVPYQPEVAPAPNFPVPQVQQPQELIDLGSQSPSTPPCATILTTSNCILRVPDDGLHKDIQERSFVFAAGLIKDQCSLTVKDCSGSYSTSWNYLFSPSTQCTAALSVCCECYGCSRGNLQLYENSCAVLFENVKCSTCSGFRLEVMEGDTVSVMNPWVDDKVSSMYVLPECELNVYTRSDFQGDAAIAKGSFDDLPYEWNDEISSYKCSCNRKGSSPATSRPTPTQGTLYPIETTVQTTTSGFISVQPITSTAKSTSASQISTSSLTSKTSATTKPPQEVITTTAKPKPEISTTPEPIVTTTHEHVVTTTTKRLTTTPEMTSTTGPTSTPTTKRSTTPTTKPSTTPTTEASTTPTTKPSTAPTTTPRVTSTSTSESDTTIDEGLPVY
ncbi:unnamed protein product [Orchesella dallaii]|uniref:Uncharacterized protein n=1 Tax=Orchesella dallaii TaxID=48710 RepID=A0ABP1RX23_9HEXA